MDHFASGFNAPGQTETAVIAPDDLSQIPPDRPVLIAGPTASGKSDLALRIAQAGGGIIVNADASQVFDCWRVITARPSPRDKARAPHLLYGHVGWQEPYSAGRWLREVTPLLKSGPRPIIVGGTGLYFSALTEGLADIPATPPDIRAEGDLLDLDTLRAALDPVTAARIDLQNRARVQRAWEVQRATGRALADWQAETPAPVLPLTGTVALQVDAPKHWLEPRIRARFAQMLDQGALDEVRAMMDHYDPALPAFRAIGVPDLAAHLRGEITLEQAGERTAIATRRFAKRQRTWFRARMSGWHRISLA